MLVPGRGWLGGAKVLGTSKLPAPGLPTYLDNSREGPTTHAGGGCLDIFFSHL